MFKLVLIDWGPRLISRTIVKWRHKIRNRPVISPKLTDPSPNRNRFNSPTLRLAICTSWINRQVIKQIMISQAYLPPNNRLNSPEWTSKTWWVGLIGNPMVDILRVIMVPNLLNMVSPKTETRRMIWYTFREHKVPMKGLKIPIVNFQAPSSLQIWIRQRCREKFILYLLWELFQDQILTIQVHQFETRRSKCTFLLTWIKLALTPVQNNKSKTWKCFRRLQFPKRIRCTCLVWDHSLNKKVPREIIWMKEARGGFKASRETWKMRDSKPKWCWTNCPYKTASTNKTAVWCEWAVTTLLLCQVKLAPHRMLVACRAIDSPINKVSDQT